MFKKRYNVTGYNHTFCTALAATAAHLYGKNPFRMHSAHIQENGLTVAKYGFNDILLRHLWLRHKKNTHRVIVHGRYMGNGKRIIC